MSLKYASVAQVGQRVRLVREADNKADFNAIRVEARPDTPVSGANLTLGFIPAVVAKWLAPLVDCGALRMRGSVLVPANKPPLSVPRMHLKLRLVLYGHPGKELSAVAHANGGGRNSTITGEGGVLSRFGLPLFGAIGGGDLWVLEEKGALMVLPLKPKP